VLALALLAPAAHGSSGPLTSRPLAAGVAHEVWAVEGSTARIHTARLAPGARVRLAVVQARGGLAGGLETPSSMCARTRGCRVALNGDFFTPGHGPRGAVVTAGRMLRSPRADHEQLSLQPLRATTAGLGSDGWLGQVQPAQGGPMALAGVNVPLGAGQLVMYTSAYGAPTPACSCVELVLAEGEQRADQLGSLAELTLTGRGQGQTPLPYGTVVLAGEGAAGQRLTALADASHASAEAKRLAVALSVAQPTRHNLGAHPVLLRDGQPAPIDAADPMLHERHPRTVVAWDAAGTVWLAAADGRQPHGPGLTASEVVAFLQRVGATDGVLLDGGGSTALATGAGPLNAPSEGRERPVSNAVVVVMEPVAATVRTAPAVPSAPVVAAAPAPVQVAPPAAEPVPAPAAPKPVVKAAPAPTAVQPPAKPVVVAESAAAQVLSRAGAERAATVEVPVAQRSMQSDRGVAVAHLGAVAAALILLATACWAHVTLPAGRGRHRRR
jgi:hypothetical protein